MVKINNENIKFFECKCHPFQNSFKRMSNKNEFVKIFHHIKSLWNRPFGNIFVPFFTIMTMRSLEKILFFKIEILFKPFIWSNGSRPNVSGWISWSIVRFQFVHPTFGNSQYKILCLSSTTKRISGFVPFFHKSWTVKSGANSGLFWFHFEWK